jgi:hypothetical protein
VSVIIANRKRNPQVYEGGSFGGSPLFDQPCDRETCHPHKHSDKTEGPCCTEPLDNSRHGETDDGSTKTTTGEYNAIGETTTFEEILWSKDGCNHETTADAIAHHQTSCEEEGSNIFLSEATQDLPGTHTDQSENSYLPSAQRSG